MPQDDGPMSDGYHSPGDTDGLGSEGELVDEDDVEWMASMIQD